MVIGGGIYSLFYYANIMPLHGDEGGYWFNFTNKAFANRKIPVPQIPNHSLSIYLAKASLAVLGHNGIGLRFPVILFGIVNVVLVYIMARWYTGSTLTASLSASLLALNPWFLHYAPDLRGFPPYMAFSILAFMSAHLLVSRGDKNLYWVLLLTAFIGGYCSLLGAVIFIFCFMATLWLLKVCQLLLPHNEGLLPLQAIEVKRFLLFTVIAASLFLYILYFQDAVLLLRSRNIQMGRPGGDNHWYLTLAMDVFSTFLGNVYLDDPESLLYKYPLPFYAFFLACYAYGLVGALREKRFYAVQFVALYMVTIGFNFVAGHYIQTRAVSYLLPFIAIFSALGLVNLLRLLISKAIFISNREGALYCALAGVLVIYLSLLSLGKYRNLDAQSGNPYEKAREYLEKNSAPVSLIISNLRDTVGGFYLGAMIRGKADFIYRNAQIDSIYYLTPAPANAVQLPDYFGQTKMAMDLSAFKLVADFKNSGVRHESVFIYQASVTNKKEFTFDNSFWAENVFIDESGAVCSKKMADEGVRITCSNYSKKACAEQILSQPVATDEDSYQLTMFRHVNDYGTKTISLAFSYPSLSRGGAPDKGGYDDIYEINPMIQVVDDLDYYRQNVVVTDLRLQKMKPGRDYKLCLAGALFNNNSLLEKVKVLDFQFQHPNNNQEK